jgi:hypothetical protein
MVYSRDFVGFDANQSLPLGARDAVPFARRPHAEYYVCARASLSDMTKGATLLLFDHAARSVKHSYRRDAQSAPRRVVPRPAGRFGRHFCKVRVFFNALHR